MNNNGGAVNNNGGAVNNKISRRKFLSGIVLMLFSAAAATRGSRILDDKETKELTVKKTSRKRADYYRELAG